MADIIADGTRLNFSEAVRFFEQKANVSTAHWTDVWRTAHARGFMVAGAASEALVEDFRQAVGRAIRDGTTLVQFRDEFDAIVKKHGWSYHGTPAWRARIIYETNLSMAYAAGRYEQLQLVKRSFPNWRYRHTSCRHPRPQHLAWDGLTLSCEDPFWDTHYPPNGWRCGCWVQAVSDQQMQSEGRTLDEAPAIETRPWRNPHTGEIHQVPVGIDPGFDYNVGKAWKEGEVGLKGPAGPSGAAPPAAAHPPGELPPLKPEGPVAAPEGAQEPAASPEAGPVAPPAATPPSNYTQWVDDRLAARRANGSARVVGRLPEAIPTEGKAPRGIVLSSKRLMHLAREIKQVAGKSIPEQDLRDLPAHLARPDVVLRQVNTGALVFAWHSPRAPAGMLVKVVVALAGHVKLAGRKHPVNSVVTAGLIDPASLRGDDYELVDGTVP